MPPAFTSLCRLRLRLAFVAAQSGRTVCPNGPFPFQRSLSRSRAPPALSMGRCHVSASVAHVISATRDAFRLAPCRLRLRSSVAFSVSPNGRWRRQLRRRSRQRAKTGLSISLLGQRLLVQHTLGGRRTPFARTARDISRFVGSAVFCNTLPTAAVLYRPIRFLGTFNIVKNVSRTHTAHGNHLEGGVSRTRPSSLSNQRRKEIAVKYLDLHHGQCGHRSNKYSRLCLA